MLNAIKCYLMFWKLKFRLHRLKKKPELYLSISDALADAFMNASNPVNKEMYSKLTEYWKRKTEGWA